MHDFPLAAALRPLDKALRRRDSFQRAMWGAAMGSGLALGLAWIARLTPLWPRATLLPRLALLWALCPLWGALWRVLRPLHIESRLRRLEQSLGLAERLSAAWELHLGRITASPALRAAQYEETIQYLESIEPRKAFALRPSRSALALTGALLLGLILTLWWPNPQEQILTQRAALQDAAALEAARIETLAETVRQLSALPDAERERLLQILETARQTLLEPTASNEARQAALLEAEQQIAAQQNPPTAPTESLTSALATPPLTPLSDAQAQALLEALQRGDFAAAETLARQQASGETTTTLSEEDQRGLSASLSQLAAAIQEPDPALAEALETAARAIAAGDENAALESLAAALAQREANAATQAVLESLQAGLQSGRERLGAAQQQAAGSSPATLPTTGDQAGGSGIAAHSEDSGSAAPYGPVIHPRLDGASGEITLPRPLTTDGAPLAGAGMETPARVPYRAFYPAYAEAAAAALSQQPLPPGLRAAIHAYFSALDPEGAALAP